MPGSVGSMMDGGFSSDSTETGNSSRNLEIGGSYELNKIRFPERGGSVDDRLGVNLRLRYNFREGSDPWPQYDEGFNTELTHTLSLVISCDWLRCSSFPS